MKNLIKVAAIVAVIIAIVSLFSSLTGEQFNEENVGRIVSIEWDEVNLRDKSSINARVLATLSRGNDVTLTGYSFKMLDGPYEDWTQVQLEDGTVGWIVTESVNWHGELWWYY